jgi:hypothetical protein
MGQADQEQRNGMRNSSLATLAQFIAIVGIIVLLLDWIF